MIAEDNHHNLVAPMEQLSRHWEKYSSVQMEPMLSWAEDYHYQRILFFEVALGSSLFFELNQKVMKSGLTPVYIITGSQFINSLQIVNWISEGIEFTLVLNHNVTPKVIKKVQALGRLAQNLKFVLIARKDWNVRNAYRSFPYFLRDRLYVDFPVSLHGGDHFYSVAEGQILRRQLEADFLGQKIKSYCPNLARYSQIDWDVEGLAVPDREWLVTQAMETSFQLTAKTKPLKAKPSWVEPYIYLIQDIWNYYKRLCTGSIRVFIEAHLRFIRYLVGILFLATSRLKKVYSFSIYKYEKRFLGLHKSKRILKKENVL